MHLCAEYDLFENSIGENSKNSLKSMKTDSERLEELRLDSLEERKLRGGLRQTHSQIEKGLLKKTKGIICSPCLWLTGQV